MTVDLRTEWNACDSITGWIGDGPLSVDNTVGFVYQGVNAISTQHTNTDEHLYVGVTQIVGDDITGYLILKDNLVETKANGGVQFVLQDTSGDRIGFGVGGNDDVGMPLDVFWNTYKLDTSEAANVPYTNVYNGTLGGFDFTGITGVGLGTVHLAKAQGNVDNIKLDRFAYHANGSYALRINGGTAGTPETMTNALNDSIINGMGLLASPTGSQYTFFGPTEFGDPGTADSYFEASNEQWTWIGGDVGVGHFPFRVVGNATGTNSFILDAVAITGVGQRAEFDLSNVNINTLDLNSVTFTDLNTITFPPAASQRVLNRLIFNSCGQVYLGDITATFLTFNGTFSTQASLLIDTVGDEANQTDFIFNRIGDVPAVVITTPGTYDLTRWTFNGYDGTPGSNLIPNSGATASAIYNLSGGAVTLNINGAASPSVRNGVGATTTVSNPATLTFTGIPDGLEGRVRKGSISLFHQQNITGGSFTYTYNYGGPEPVTISIGGVANDGFAYERQIIDINLSGGTQTIPLSFELNPSYKPT